MEVYRESRGHFHFNREIHIFLFSIAVKYIFVKYALYLINIFIYMIFLYINIWILCFWTKRSYRSIYGHNSMTQIINTNASSYYLEAGQSILCAINLSPCIFSPNTCFVTSTHIHSLCLGLICVFSNVHLIRFNKHKISIL